MFSLKREFPLLFWFLNLSSLQLECEAHGYPPAPNCARLECPPYKVIHSEKNFEIRSYELKEWVYTSTTSQSYVDGAFRGFRVLFSYYHGNNREKVEINMTAPVLVAIDKPHYHVFFYVPQQTSYDLPTPLTDEIEPVMLPKQRYVAVRRYGGFIDEMNIASELSALRKSLQGTQWKDAAADGRYSVAGYNSPFELVNRVNEIMIWFE